MDTVDSKQSQDFSIVSPTLTVGALRDSGYKDTDHAVAELIDNAIDAGADLIQLFAVEKPPASGMLYAQAQIDEIAVADNGTGMDENTLRRALRFGDGTTEGPTRTRIGRFGVGLPQSSVSQCRRVDIWTWKRGPDNALHCHLDLDEIAAGMTSVPPAIPAPVPDRWRAVAACTSEFSGTLVVWSRLDRVRWRRAAKTLQHTAWLCGRIYRKYLGDPNTPTNIELVHAEKASSDSLVAKSSWSCLVNDPLYLLTPSAAPVPFADTPMFRLFNKKTFRVGRDEQRSEIVVRCTMARPDAINEKKSCVPWPRSYAKAGDAPWGKDADRNKGVSIVRGRRELQMSRAWVNNYEPEERWWSVEVQFDPSLDALFGVVNNKQYANEFVFGAGFDWKEHRESERESFGTLSERWRENDPRADLLDVWIFIDKQIREMRKERELIMKHTGTTTAPDDRRAGRRRRHDHHQPPEGRR